MNSAFEKPASVSERQNMQPTQFIRAIWALGDTKMDVDDDKHVMADLW